MVGLEVVGTQEDHLESVFCLVFHCKVKDTSIQKLENKQASVFSFPLPFVFWYLVQTNQSQWRNNGANIWLSSCVLHWSFRCKMFGEF